MCCRTPVIVTTSVQLTVMQNQPPPPAPATDFCMFPSILVILLLRQLLGNEAALEKYCDEYVCLCVCLSVCLSARISPETRAIFTKFECMLPMSVARSSSDMLTIGRIAYRREMVTGMRSAGEV